MKRPEIITITFEWIDSYGTPRKENFDATNLEGAHDLLGMMIGEICEDDLKP